MYKIMYTVTPVIKGSLLLLSGTPTYLCIAEHLQHICVKGFNRLVVASENLLLNGAQIQGVRHLLIILAVPDGNQEESHYRQFQTSKSTDGVDIPKTLNCKPLFRL